jgi:hypothetical protein
VAYLGLDGGGYTAVAYGQLGVLLWWALGLGLLLGVLPLGRISRSGLLAAGLLGAFAAWSVLSLWWTDAAAATWAEAGRAATYFGILCTGLALRRDQSAARSIAAAVTTALTLLAILALASRLFPALFPAGGAEVLMDAGDTARLSYPVGYWNALAAVAIMAVPLLVAYAGCSTTPQSRLLAMAGLPPVLLTAYLTFSRAGILFALVAAAVLLALTGQRARVLVALVTGLIAGAVTVAVALAMPALVQGEHSPEAEALGIRLLVVVALVSIVAGFAHEALHRLIARRGPAPEGIPRRTAIGVLAVAAVALLVGAVALGVPGRAMDAWEPFKDPNISLSEGAGADARLAAVSGNGRYQYWQAALAEGASKPLTGHGAGSFEGWWLRHRPFNTFVQTAHSAYLQAFGEVGLVGALLLIALVVVVLLGGVRRSLALERLDRTVAAAVAAACTAFAFWAGIDWLWQVAVVPAAFLLLGASVLGRPEPGTGPPRWPTRALGALAALAALVVVAIPLVATAQLEASRAAARAGDFGAALGHAQAARAVEPWSAPAALQEGLVQERRGEPVAALLAAHQAAELEPLGWENWLVVSRLEGQNGDPGAGRLALAKARLLNPLSPEFEEPPPATAP